MVRAACVPRLPFVAKIGSVDALGALEAGPRASHAVPVAGNTSLEVVYEFMNPSSSYLHFITPHNFTSCLPNHIPTSQNRIINMRTSAILGLSLAALATAAPLEARQDASGNTFDVSDFVYGCTTTCDW